MAYSLSDRFPKLPKYYPLLDPGTYEKEVRVRQNGSLAPFLSRTPRVTHPPSKIWTNVIYSADYPRRIPNCSAMASKQSRFPWQYLKEKDMRDFICECNTPQKCECLLEEKEKHVKAELKTQQQIFIGPAPRANIQDGSPFPFKRNKATVFLNEKDKEINRKGHKTRLYSYDNQPQRLTDFYQGCKWSRWTSKRTFETLNEGPSPTTYTLKQEQTTYKLCIEKDRANRRKTSKQCRFIEMIQRQNIKENLPGPGTYNPQYPRGIGLQFLGPRAERFANTKNNVIPGPASYKVKRDFDMPELLKNPRYATLIKRSPFGTIAPRFKSINHEGPGPANYNTNLQICKPKYCPMAPLGSSSARFVDVQCKDGVCDAEDICLQTKNIESEKLKGSWMFKSRTIRMKTLSKELNDPSSIDFSLRNIEKCRPKQNTVPFLTSEPRFQPWHNWIPVYNMQDTPAVGEYEPEKVSCAPAVVRGPIFRSERFKCEISQTPPCNAYKVSEGIEAILRTHNAKLKENINRKHEFRWKGFSFKNKLSDKERESYLINLCLTLLNTDMFCAEQTFIEKGILSRKLKKVGNNKMLRSFLYKNVIPNYF